MKKSVTGIHKSPQGHWVGDGFPVRSLFSYDRFGQAISPFLLLDYAGPLEFTPAAKPRGVGEHPHRGFETVTIVYSGEVAHRDSTGQGGVIGPGDVQWMTAAGGIVHEEFHSPRFTEHGGTLEMVQLWVNLPARDKMSPPRYQTIGSAAIPVVELPEGSGRVRVIAGEYQLARGPASTFSPLNVWDVRLTKGARFQVTLPEGHIAAIALLKGVARINDSRPLNAAELAVLAREGRTVEVEASEDALILFLSGLPIEEPIAGYGPFVMNTREEIETAMNDFRSGKFGQIPARELKAPAPA
jgi:redox-sensitive bicupin YhaK (pirin superfamily)